MLDLYSHVCSKMLRLIFRISPRFGMWIDKKLDLKPE